MKKLLGFLGFGTDSHRRRREANSPAQSELLEMRSMLCGGEMNCALPGATEAEVITNAFSRRGVDLDLFAHTDTSDIVGETGDTAWGDASASITGDVTGRVKKAEVNTSVSQHEVATEDGFATIVQASATIYVDVTGVFDVDVSIDASTFQTAQGEGVGQAHFEGRGRLFLSLSVYATWSLTESDMGTYESTYSNGSYYFNGGRIAEYSVYITCSVNLEPGEIDATMAIAYLSAYGYGQGNGSGFVSTSWFNLDSDTASQERLDSYATLSASGRITTNAYGSTNVNQGMDSTFEDFDVNWAAWKKNPWADVESTLEPIRSGTNEQIWNATDAFYALQYELLYADCEF